MPVIFTASLVCLARVGVNSSYQISAPSLKAAFLNLSFD